MKRSDKLNLVQDFDYKIVYSKRRTLSIIVNPEKGVIVKAPLRTPVKIIHRFVHEKASWIAKTLTSFNSLRRIDCIGYSSGDILLFEGKELTIKVIEAVRPQVRVVDGIEIEVGISGEKNSVKIRAILESWIKLTARKKLTLQFADILSRYKSYNLMPTAFTVSRMKKRWGSCSIRGRIAISYDLVRLKPVFSEYVIIHELCHLIHHNHSTDFYKLLGELYPRWKEVRKELHKYIR